jgi:hypothetical protein
MVRIKKKHELKTFRQVAELRGESTSLSDIGRTSTQRVLALRNCQKHYALLTLRALNRKKTAHGCHICEYDSWAENDKPGAPQVSRFTVDAAEVIPGCFPPDAKIITEARILKDFGGGMDFTVEYKHRGATRVLHIEVDGEQHFTKPCHGTSVQEQRQVDKERNKKVLSQRRHMLRLHYQDQGSWPDEIKRARARIESDSSRSNVMFSHSYKNNDLYKS